MKVLLIQPPIEDFYDTSIRTYPLGLLCIASKLSAIADVAVYDARTGRKPKVVVGHPYPELEPFYLPGLRTPFSFFGDYYRFGDDEEETRKRIEEEKPDVVGVASLFTTYAREALAVARIAKDVSPEIVTVMGGLHPTLFPEHVLRDPQVDFCVRGDGDTPFFKLVEALKAGADPKRAVIPGLCFKDDGRACVSEISTEKDIDVIPARRLIDRDTYRINRNPYTFFLTSRGCPFHCVFCGKPPVPYRRRSLASIGEEIQGCLELGIKAIDFEDDMLSLDREFFGAVLDRFMGTDLILSAMNGIYADTLDEHLLDKMHRAGFRRLSFSLVDASDSIRWRQGRGTGKTLESLFPYLRGSPFLVEVHYIVGLPGQRPEDVVETMLLLMGEKVLLGPSIYYLVPNTAAFADFATGDVEPLLPVMRSSAMFPVNPLFPRKTTYTLVKLARFINYVKARIDRAEGGVARLTDLLDDGKTAYEREIMRTLLLDKRFVRYDSQIKELIDEPQDQGLVRRFFDSAKGRTIMGYATCREQLSFQW